MLKEEFLNLIKSPEPTESAWELIQTVYTFHPSISDVGGKKQIAALWDIGGIRLIADMLKTAERVRDILEKIAVLKGEIARYEEDWQNIREGY